jgi:hypothetical protein
MRQALNQEVEVRAGRLTDLGILDLGPGFPRLVWLGCKGVSTNGAMCDTGRWLPAPRLLSGPGFGVVRDSETWAALWQLDTGDARNRRQISVPRVKWGSEVVLLFAKDFALLPMGHSPVNRVLEWPDSVIVELGPDSIFQRGDVFVDYFPAPLAVVARRSEAPFKFRWLPNRSISVPVVDWKTIVQLCSYNPSRPECSLHNE